MIHHTTKVSEQTNRNLPARNTLVQVQLLTLYIYRESHNAQHHKQTDRWHDYANSRSYRVAVRSVKKRQKL